MRGRWTVGSVGVLALIVVGLVASIGDVAVASGGGGCGKPVTDEATSRVVIRNFCFGPTIARVRRGTTVTFRNRDGFPHTVLGANGSWGSFERIGGGSRDVYRFTRRGVYPYVCTYHVGMVGAVVVGRRAPRVVPATTTGAGPVVRVAQEPETQQAPGSDRVLPPSHASASTAPGWSTAVGGAVAVMVAIATGLIAYGRRRHRTIAA